MVKKIYNWSDYYVTHITAFLYPLNWVRYVKQAITYRSATTHTIIDIHTPTKYLMRFLRA